jgi:hypothetical protein
MEFIQGICLECALELYPEMNLSSDDHPNKYGEI